jgi:hypothetical protein
MEFESELTYVRRERDWLSRAQADGRDIPHQRLLPMLPPGVGGGTGNGASSAGHGANGTSVGAGGGASVHHT